jgi:hypothetical protein
LIRTSCHKKFQRIITKFVLVIILYPTFIFGQNRENTWQVGIKTVVTNYPYPAISFNQQPADTFSVIRSFGFFITNTGVCDTSGNTLFYTDGVSIGNRNHDTLFNSTNFNPGYASNVNNQTLNIHQAAVILPNPQNENLYYLIHESAEQFSFQGNNYQQPLTLRYSIVNMDLDSGNGAIENSAKSVILETDTFTNGGLNACKHGNGKDWWLVAPKFYSNTYAKYLVKADSIHSLNTQAIGDSIKFNTLIQSVFSPDGSKYAVVTPANGLNIFSFDRCTGLFYDSTIINVPNPTPGYPENQAYGVAFSSNSRFLYVILYARIFQYDTWSTNIPSTGIIVADWDTFSNPFPTYFFGAQLAPDNRIYIGTYGSNYCLHYIENPDSLGIACNVIQHSFPLSFPNISVPTYPNYDLGKKTGSPCDTITSIFESELSLSKIKIFPNPSSDHLIFNYDIPDNEYAILRIYDSTGIEIAKHQLYGSMKTYLMHVINFPSGFYYYSFQSAKNGFINGKFVVIH